MKGNKVIADFCLLLYNIVGQDGNSLRFSPRYKHFLSGENNI